MASSYDPRKHLERLAEKQMKCTLHAKFLEDCLSNEMVPNGLTLKLKVSVGNEPEDQELQKTVDRLLEKTSLHIVNIVKEGHMRKAKNLSRAIEEERGKVKKDLSDEKLFEMDSSIFKITQEKKDVLTVKHQKKLTELIQRQTGENTKEGETFNTVQKKKDKKVSTKQIVSSNSEAKQAKSETNRQSKPRRKRKSKHKSNIAGQCSAKKTNNSSANEKSKQISNNDDVIIVGETKPNKNQETRHTSVQEQTKNAFAPGTRMTYSEATKRGAKTAAQESTERSLQETLQTVVLTMQELIKSIQGKGQHVGLSGAKTEMRGKRPRKEQNRSLEAKRRF